MKTYFVAMTKTDRWHILGGGWTEAAAREEAKLNNDSLPVQKCVTVAESTGRKIEDDGDGYKLAHFCATRRAV